MQTAKLPDDALWAFLAKDASNELLMWRYALWSGSHEPSIVTRA